MALPPLASVEDLGLWLQEPLSGSSAQWAASLLDAVSALVRSEAGSTWESVSVPDEARIVTLTVAARVYRNPEAASQRTETRGPFSESFTFANPPGVGLYLTAADKALLQRLNPKSRGLWTMQTTRQDGESTDIYVPVEGGGGPIPWYPGDGDLW